MRAAHVPHSGVIEVTDWPDPQPEAPGQFVVRMLEASLCGSDVHCLFEGNLHPKAALKAGYPGHEGVGVVVASRAEAFPEGRLVLALPPGPYGGCFAQYQLLDERHALLLPDALGAGDRAGLRRFALAQQLGTTVFAMKHFCRSEIAGGRTAAVLGAGSAGLFFVVQALRRGFSQVAVLDRNPERVRLAESLGAVGAGSTAEFVELVARVSGGRGAALAIDAVGNDELRRAAVEVAGADGVLGLFGISSAITRPSPFNFYPAQRKCLDLVAVTGAQSEPGLASFREAIDLIGTEPSVVGHVSGPEFGLAELARAFQIAAHPMPGDGVKCFVRIWDED